MKRCIAYLSLLALTLGSTFGCSMCCGPYDDHYPNFGGKHQRVDPAYGRVGSRLSDPNAQAYGPSADSNLKPAPEPFSSGGSSNGNDNGGLDSDLDLDAELERMRNEAEGLREEIDAPDGDGRPRPEALPDPKNPTASRFWQQRPLRSGQGWR